VDSRTRPLRVRRSSAAVALAAAALSCGGTSATAVHNVVAVTRLAAADPSENHVTLGQACVASGIETCFNATDDDCNGLVDEGCGLGEGTLQIVIAWDQPDADIELEVTDPQHDVAEVGRPTRSGLVKDWDCPSNLELCAGQNVEVVRSVGETVPLGRYEVAVVWRHPATGIEGVTVRVGGHIADAALSGRVELSRQNPHIVLEFLRFLPRAVPGAR
jgi:hypothetical protein